MRNDYTLGFPDQPWEEPQPGMRLKNTVRAGTCFRLVEFLPEFEEEAWCVKEHRGYVISGGFTLDFQNDSATFTEGQALWVPAGCPHRHHGNLPANQPVRLILIEPE